MILVCTWWVRFLRRLLDCSDSKFPDRGLDGIGIEADGFVAKNHLFDHSFPDEFVDAPRALEVEPPPNGLLGPYRALPCRLSRFHVEFVDLGLNSHSLEKTCQIMSKILEYS